MFKIKHVYPYICAIIFFSLAGCARNHNTRRTLTTPKPIHITSLEKALNNFHTVQPGVLYRSAQLSPHFLESMIKKYDIKTIINLRGCNENKRWWQKEKKLSERLGVMLYNIPMSAAHLPDKNNLLSLLQIYQSAPRPILIHCYSGADRTGEAAALWVLEQQKKDLKIALKQLSLRYGHMQPVCPAKRFFIKRWKGRQWLINDYNPKSYDAF